MNKRLISLLKVSWRTHGSVVWWIKRRSFRWSWSNVHWWVYRSYNQGKFYLMN